MGTRPARSVARSMAGPAGYPRAGAVKIPRMAPGGLGSLGRMLLAAGAAVALLGLLLILAERFPGLRIGKLPGDIAVERDRWRFYFPLGTSVLISVVLTLLLWIFGRR
jgi:Protein of unknown function (DUF2905)